MGRGLSFVKDSNLEKIVESEDGAQFIVNEITITLTDNSTYSDAIELANVVNGTITGHISSINRYKVEIATETIEDLEALIEELRGLNDSRIEVVVKNYIIGVF